MSVGVQPLALGARGKTLAWRRLILAAFAVGLVAGALALLAWFFAAPAPAPVRNPFGMGVREAALQPTGIGGTILVIQGSFYKSLQGAVAALKESGGALWSLLTLGFAYGIFHAAGPGHGKAVIAGYLVANERTLAKGFGLSLAAALVQALVAIALVGTVAMALRATAARMGQVSAGVEWASFAAVAVLGLVVTWRKAGKLAHVIGHVQGQDVATRHDCDHVHLPPPEKLERVADWRELAAVVLAAGIRPCAGALVVLVFALSQGLFAAGIAATFAMALGTALTTGVLAALAVFAKRIALHLAGGRGSSGAVAIAGLELLAGAFVLVLGASLLLGMWSAAGS